MYYLSMLLCMGMFFSAGLYADKKPKNKIFRNIVVRRHAHMHHSATVKGNLNIGGTIAGKNIQISNINGINVASFVQGPSDPSAGTVPVFAGVSGLVLASSPVSIDNAGNIAINGITKNGNTFILPSTSGSAGTFLGSDGAGNLIFGTPFGAGNVSTALSFGSNNVILRSDTTSGSQNIKVSGVVLDDSNNISGINQLSASTITGSLSGNAATATTAVNFSGTLHGDVTGTQGATVVNVVGGSSAINIASATAAANNATPTNTNTVNSF